MTAARLAHLLRCPACEAELEERGVNEVLELASCQRCGKVVDLALPRREPALFALFARADAPAPAQAVPPAPAPEARPGATDGFEVEEAAGRLAVTWSRPLEAQLSALFNVTLLAAFGLYVLFESGLDATPAGPGLFLAAVGGWAWAAGAALFNRVRLVASPRALEVTPGPLPWTGRRRLARDEVKQLFCELLQEPNKRGEAVRRRYALSAVVGDEGRRVRLLSGLSSAEAARWLEAALERALGVQPGAVGGELEP